MSKKLEEMTPAELKAQADALLAAADLEDVANMEEIPVKPTRKSTKKKAVGPDG